MTLNLYIYSGLGNIIAIVDSVREDISLDTEDVLNLQENEGVAFDQLIQVLPPQDPEIDFDVKIHNNDGSVASNCINGARCVAKFIEDHSLSASKQLKVNTIGGIWRLESMSEGNYSATFLLSDVIKPICISHEEMDVNLDCISLGNPHGVAFEETNPKLDLLKVGKDLQNNSLFPDGVNFGLANKVSSNEINLRVYERGAGETLACGSGACAAAVIGIANKEMIAPVKVNFQLGSLLVDYKKENNMISAIGSATFVEEIVIES